jgi:hypothetical protein
MAEEKGAVWWGLATKGDPDWHIAEEWVEELRGQIAAAVPTHVFIVDRLPRSNAGAPICSKVEYDTDKVDPSLVPVGTDSSLGHHLWVKITRFEKVTRDWLLRELDPARPSRQGRPIALGNQTNPLIVRWRTAPRAWWVNQGASYPRARAGGYIWAPGKSKAGHEVAHWRTMRDLRTGDRMLHYANGQLRSVGQWVARRRSVPRPACTDRAHRDPATVAGCRIRTLRNGRPSEAGVPLPPLRRFHREADRALPTT